MANEYYYNDGKLITCEQAHSLKDKSKLIVSNKVRTSTFLNNFFKKEEVIVEEVVEEEVVEVVKDAK